MKVITMPKVPSHPMSLFADDTINSTNVQNYKVEITNKTFIIRWVENNNLKINIEKAKLTMFSQHSNINMIIFYRQSKHNNASEHTSKSLGLTIANKLDWKTYTEESNVH